MKERRYGRWSFNPKGRAEDKTLCIMEVWPREGIWVSHQCYRKRGYGSGGLYCKQHAQIMEKRKQ